MSFNLFNLFSRKKSVTVQPRTVMASSLRSVTDRENSSYFSTATDSSSDELCSYGERKRLRACCRKVFLDNPFALNICRALSLYTYGNGPTLQVFSEDETMNSEIERLFNVWRRQINYDEKFLLALQALGFDGESFMLLTDDPSIDCGLNLELVESYRVNNLTGGLDENEFDGILYDEWGHPQFYRIQKTVPNPNFPHLYQYDLIPTSRIEHLYLPQLPAQRRGLPLLQTCLNTMASLSQLEDATISAAQTAASLSFVVQSDFNPDMDSTEQLCSVEGGGTFEAFDNIKLPGRNSGVVLPSGLSISQLKSEQPSQQFIPFKQDALISLGASMGCPRNVALSDSSSYNFSSAKMDSQIFERWCKVLQGRCETILNSHFKSFLSASIDNLTVQTFLEKYDSLESIRFRWIFPEPSNIDPEKAAKTDTMLLQSNCLTLRDYYARRGRDWRAELQQLALEKQTLKELGLEVSDITTKSVELQEEEITE